MNTKIIYEKQDLRNLSWTELPSTGWIGGSFLKAVDFQEKPFRYYKLSSYDSIKGIIGHECVNELIVDRLLNILGISHIDVYKRQGLDISCFIKVICCYFVSLSDGTLWET